MRPEGRVTSHLLRACFVGLLAVALVAGDARCVCNVIPAAIQPFRGALASIDRPFAGPGDWVELSPDTCGRPQGIPQQPNEVVVSVIFKPPGSGPRTVLLLTPDSCTSPETT